MNEVYVVTESDDWDGKQLYYNIVGIYNNKELASKAKEICEKSESGHDTINIETWTLNEMPDEEN